ncbi:MAG: ABC transporter permease [Firmicutes bacterium]|nr:ABC transporter permease [Bacillota bacterium]
MTKGLQELPAKLGVPRLIIIGFLVFIFAIAFITGLPIGPLVSASLIRIGMNGVLVLAMVPTISAGVGLNFGLPVGILCGLVGALISMQLNLQGFAGFWSAIAFSLPLAIVAGWGYALLLNRVKGQEMMVGTYVGFSSVAFMCIFWLLAPFDNPELVWAIGGRGLRSTLTLDNHFGKVLNKLFLVSLGGVEVPVGLLAFFGLLCLLVHLVFRTKLGLAVKAAGSNPRFAEAAGIKPDKTRQVGVILSTVLGAIGIVVYAQSYGFIQLYMAPLMMGFPAVAAILIGGASLQRASISHVVLGTFLFQTLLTTTLPVTSRVIQGDISEVARLIVSNGMILYALTRGERREIA